jgi:hypothetical protein
MFYCRHLVKHCHGWRDVLALTSCMNSFSQFSLTVLLSSYSALALAAGGIGPIKPQLPIPIPSAIPRNASVRCEELLNAQKAPTQTSTEKQLTKPHEINEARQEDLENVFTEMKAQIDTTVNYMVENKLPTPMIEFAQGVQQDIEQILTQPNKQNYSSLLQTIFPLTRAQELVDGHKQLQAAGKPMTASEYHHSADKKNISISLVNYTEVNNYITNTTTNNYTTNNYTQPVTTCPWLNREPNDREDSYFTERLTLEKRMVELLEGISNQLQIRPSFGLTIGIGSFGGFHFVGAIGYPIAYVSFRDRSVLFNNHLYSPYSLLSLNLIYTNRLIEQSLNELIGRNIDTYH